MMKSKAIGSMTGWLVLLAFLAVVPISEAGFLWRGGFGGWNDPRNWRDGVVPTASDGAVFTAASPVDFGDGAVVKSLEVGAYYNGSYTEKPMPITFGTGPIGSQKLTLSDGGKIYAEGYMFYTQQTFNSQIILGESGGSGSYSFEPRYWGILVFNGPILGGSGGEQGDKELKISPLMGGAKINGSISDGGSASLSVVVSSAEFAAHNFYTGRTQVNWHLVLSVQDAISSLSEIILGGTIETGFDQHFGSLSLIEDGGIIEIPRGATGTDLAFADSHLDIWSGTLSLQGFRIGTDTLRFGADETGLTQDQLSRILLQGYTAGIDGAGFVTFTAVPEPASIFLMGVGGLFLFGALVRKRAGVGV